MLQNAYLLAKIGADTAENELNFAEILPNGVPEPRNATVASSGQVSGGKTHGSPKKGGGHAQVSAKHRKLAPQDLAELHKVFERADSGKSGYVEVSL